MVLTVLLLMQMLPAEALAAERLEIGEMVTIPTQTLDSSEEVHIIAELTDKRTEYSKEYLLSNGLHMASVYANAVHYEEDGQWKEIDNTLRVTGTAAASGGGHAFPVGAADSLLLQKPADGLSQPGGKIAQGVHGGAGGAVFDKGEHIACDHLAAKLPLRKAGCQPSLFNSLTDIHGFTS